jgi:MobA/MobL family protein
LTEKAREWSGLTSGAALAKAFRALVAKTMNEALAAEGKGGLVHVEHRSFKARGSSQLPTRHQGPTRTSIRNKQARQLRAAWERDGRQQQVDRHGVELAALKSRHDAATAAKLTDLAERERRGIAAIQAELARAQAADVPAKGARRLFAVATGNAMRADSDRQTRAAQRVEDADRQIAALKASLDVERAAYTQAQAVERTALVERHGREDQQIRQAVTARTAFDRAAIVEERRHEAREIARNRDVHDGPTQPAAQRNRSDRGPA